MDIRPLRLPDDIDGLSRLDAGSTSDTVIEVVTTPTGFGLTEVSAPTPITKDHRFLAGLTDPERPWTDGYVAVEGNDAIGFAATVYYRWNRRQVLWHLFVDRDHRGLGVGRALVEYVLEVARGNGARQLWLETQDTNAPAVAAYQALGFRVVGLDRTLYDSPYADETALYLARPVTPAETDG